MSACTTIAFNDAPLTGEQLGASEINLVATVETAEAWASLNRQTLLALLTDPSQDERVRGLLPACRLRVAHVVGLVGEIPTKLGGPWKRHYEGKPKRSRAFVMHVWLFHLGGGLNEKLVAPTDGRTSKSRSVEHGL